MAFTDYKTVDDVAEKYGIQYARADFVVPMAGPPLTDSYRAELAFTLANVPFHRSEGFVCEALIYPTLREVWKHYHDHLTLLSHEPLDVTDDLHGVVDYLACRRSRLGPLIPDRPVLLVAEAKRDDFNRGWAQTLAAMVAARRQNTPTAYTYFGISTNGRGWEFGRLEGDTFTQDTRVFDIGRVDDLAAALHFVFASCRTQVAAPPAAPATAGA